MTPLDPARIALVCPYSLAVRGGVQNHVLGLADWLGGQGHETFVLAPGEPPADLRRRYRRTHIASSGRAVPVPYNGSVARVSFDPVTSARVGRWLQRVRPDVVHIHEPITPSIALLALRRVPPDVPVLATFHTATPGSRTMRLARRVLPAAVARIDGAVAVSPAARRVARSHIGVDSVVIGNGFSYADLAAGPAYRPRTGGPVITFLGRLSEPRKGLATLAAAWPAIRTAHPDARVVVAGSGHARVPADWTVLGPVDDRDRSALLRATDVFVAPHRARESFGLVLMEALAAGAAVVASDLPAFVDVLDDGDGPVASLFARDDPADLAGAVTATLAHPPAAARRERGRALAAQYDWSRIGPQVAAQYEAQYEARYEARYAAPSTARHAGTRTGPDGRTVPAVGTPIAYAG